jgi:hypothetical protein
MRIKFQHLKPQGTHSTGLQTITAALLGLDGEGEKMWSREPRGETVVGAVTQALMVVDQVAAVEVMRICWYFLLDFIWGIRRIKDESAM